MGSQFRVKAIIGLNKKDQCLKKTSSTTITHVKDKNVKLCKFKEF